MINCGISFIDDERNEIINDINKLLYESFYDRDEKYLETLKHLKNKLFHFRMKLAYNKGTEFLETNFGWTGMFDELNDKLESQIKLFQ